MAEGCHEVPNSPCDVHTLSDLSCACTLGNMKGFCPSIFDKVRFFYRFVHTPNLYPRKATLNLPSSRSLSASIAFINHQHLLNSSHSQTDCSMGTPMACSMHANTEYAITYCERMLCSPLLLTPNLKISSFGIAPLQPSNQSNVFFSGDVHSWRANNRCHSLNRICRKATKDGLELRSNRY